MADIETYPDETLEERVKSWEKEKKAMIGDLQAEREKRQFLEERLTRLENSVPEPEEGSPEEKVTRFTQDPDGYVSDVVSQAVEPLQKKILELEVDRKVERAKKWIAKKEGIDPDEVEDKYGLDLVRIGKERGFVNLDAEKGIRSSYEILIQERKEKAEKEAEREKTISGQSTESVRTIIKNGSARFTREEIARMEPDEFNRRYNEIKEAQSKGLIK